MIPCIDQDRSGNECESDGSSIGNIKGWQEIHLREDIATDEDSIATDVSSNEDNRDVDEFPMDMDDNDDARNGENAPHDIVNDVLMFEAAGLTISQVFIMVQAFSLMFYFSNEATTAMVIMLKILAGPRFQNLNTSKYIIGQRFITPEDNISYIYDCKKCNNTLGPVNTSEIPDNNRHLCESYEEEYRLTPSSLNCFVLVDIEFKYVPSWRIHIFSQS